jgi:hypothetical protein
MNLDIRVPIGLLFALMGGLLAAWGLVSDPALYERSLGVNINLAWGAAMAVFGLAMLARAAMRRRPGPRDRSQ